MAENRAAFVLRRRRSLGFSKCRCLRPSFKVPSRSIFFFNRRSALSTDSPFLSLISVNRCHFLSGTEPSHCSGLDGPTCLAVRLGRLGRRPAGVNWQKTSRKPQNRNSHGKTLGVPTETHRIDLTAQNAKGTEELVQESFIL